jgi:two-component system sensor histidine kinase QseC
MRERRSSMSLSRRVLALALAAVALAWIAGAWFSYSRVRHEADELLDGYLAQTAAVLHAQIGDDRDFDELEIEHAPELHRYARRIAFQFWDRGSVLRLHSESAPNTRMSPRDEGFDDVNLDGRTYRVFSSWNRDRRLLVQVAELRLDREEISAGVAGALALPLAITLPVLAVLLGLAVRTGLGPLLVLDREVSARTPDNLAPLDEGPRPAELAPLVTSLDRLLARVRDSLARERRFTSDAAHELRTPIAALRAQAQVARASSNETMRNHALDQLIAACDRAARLVDQMLTLSRVDPLVGIDPACRCDLADVARDAVAEAAPSAVAVGVDIGFDATSSIVRAEAGLLAILLRNLLDNAVRYAGRGSSVRVRVDADRSRTVLEVADDGPGMTPELMARVGERFVRGASVGVEGSGLGLSIVAQIARLHGAQLTYERPKQGTGLSFAWFSL